MTTNSTKTVKEEINLSRNPFKNRAFILKHIIFWLLLLNYGIIVVLAISIGSWGYLGGMFLFWTHLSNLLILVSYGWFILGDRKIKLVQNLEYRHLITAYILYTGLGASFLLAPMLAIGTYFPDFPQALTGNINPLTDNINFIYVQNFYNIYSELSTILEHVIIPSAVVIDFVYDFKHKKNEKLTMKRSAYYFIIPILYSSLILISGNVTGYYPYAFFDNEVWVNGWWSVIGFSLILLAYYIAGNFFLISATRTRKEERVEKRKEWKQKLLKTKEKWLATIQKKH